MEREDTQKLARRRFLAGLALAGISTTVGCGTLMYPDRRGQPAGQLDWGVVLLDGIGLLLFFVPGLIAFAVDFATGAIYLPPREEYQLSPAKPPPLRRVVIEKKPLSQTAIAETVTAETGERITLDDGTYSTTELNGIDQFWPERDRLAAIIADASS